MASIRKYTSGGQTLHRLGVMVDRRRREVRLGAIGKTARDEILNHANRLESAYRLGVAPEDTTQLWADNKLDPAIRERFAEWGLLNAINPRLSTDAGRLLGPFLDAYIAERTDLKPGTVTNYRQARRLLVQHFGEFQTLRAITPADADRFKRWLATIVVKRDNDGHPAKYMAPATISKHIKRTRTIFKTAVRDRLLTENPFADLKAGTEANKDRHFFVDAATTAAVFKAIGDDNHDWRLIFAFARYAGMRCPSEVTAIKWSDVLFDQGKIRIDSSKTGVRYCPIFPELRPHLESAAADREKDLIMGRQCIRGYSADSNLGTQLQRYIRRAGLEPWEKTFINLRSTRRTELQADWPSHVVDTWLGHSTRTAEKHYLQTTENHFKAAAAIGDDDPSNTSGVDSDSSGAVVAHSVAQSATASACVKHSRVSKNPGKTAFPEVSDRQLLTPTGLEPVLPP